MINVVAAIVRDKDNKILIAQRNLKKEHKESNTQLYPPPVPPMRKPAQAS